MLRQERNSLSEANVNHQEELRQMREDFNLKNKLVEQMRQQNEADTKYLTESHKLQLEKVKRETAETLEATEKMAEEKLKALQEEMGKKMEVLRDEANAAKEEMLRSHAKEIADYKSEEEERENKTKGRVRELEEQLELMAAKQDDLAEEVGLSRQHLKKIVYT